VRDSGNKSRMRNFHAKCANFGRSEKGTFDVNLVFTATLACTKRALFITKKGTFSPLKKWGGTCPPCPPPRFLRHWTYDAFDTACDTASTIGKLVISKKLNTCSFRHFPIFRTLFFQSQVVQVLSHSMVVFYSALYLYVY
jgi:hypothetical protein